MADIDITKAESWPEFLTPAQVSAILQVSDKTVRALCDSGDLLYVAYGPRMIRIPKSSLVARKQAQVAQEAAGVAQETTDAL